MGMRTVKISGIKLSVRAGYVHCQNKWNKGESPDRARYEHCWNKWNKGQSPERAGYAHYQNKWNKGESPDRAGYAQCQNKWNKGESPDMRTVRISGYVQCQNKWDKAIHLRELLQDSSLDDCHHSGGIPRYLTCSHTTFL